MDVSIIIASNKPDLNHFLAPTIDSILGFKSKYQFEIVVVTSSDIKSDNPHIRVIRDYLNIGCSYAYNLGIHAAKGKMITIMTDDWRYTTNWETMFDELQKVNKPYQIIGTIRTKVDNIPYSNILTFTKECINSNLFGGNLFNPGMFHQYLEMDVAMLLNSVQQEITYADVGIQSLGEHKAAWHNKQRFFKADGIIFRKLWGDKLNPDSIPIYPSHEITYANDQEMEALVNYQMTIARK